MAADFEIEFYLADVDHTTTSRGIKDAFSPAFDEVMFKEHGGINPRPREQYLNIWICDLTIGLDGYARFPGEANDGVVIDYAFFLKKDYEVGHILTHLVGHWLNLRHIWGDDDGCKEDDAVEDTPLQGFRSHRGPLLNCSGFPQVSCNNKSKGGDMFMNYMDNGACQYLFTHGQKARMEALFAPGGARASLTSRGYITVKQPITLPVLASGTYKACGIPLEASSAVATDTKVTYQSDRAIVLGPGFSITPGDMGRFSARIEGCTNNARLAYKENAKREEGVATEPALVLTPNPASSRLTIGYPFQPKTPYTIRVYDLIGRLVLTHQFVSGTASAELNLTRLKNGSYVLQCILPTGGRSSKRFVVAR